jgi:hypothetical protein
MTRLVHHIRSNVVAYLALFIALGGTSYAAISVPRNSVGAPQIRNHSITAVKFNQKSIAASVRAWVNLQWRGSHVVATASSSRVLVSSAQQGVSVTWPHTQFPQNCSADATPQISLNATSHWGFVTATFHPTESGGALLILSGFTPTGQQVAQPADVLIVCP